jgi:hypothetical protein
MANESATRSRCRAYSSLKLYQGIWIQASTNSALVGHCEIVLQWPT